MATVRYWANLNPKTALTYFEGINTSENSYTFEENDDNHLLPNNIGVGSSIRIPRIPYTVEVKYFSILKKGGN